MIINNSKRKDMKDADGRVGIGKGSFSLGDLEPEVMEVLGARDNAPRSKRMGREARLKPLGEGLRRGEGQGFGVGVGEFHGIGRYLEKTARV